MASIINASSTGSGGLISTGDASGVLQLQSNGTVALTVATSGNVGIGDTSPSSLLSLASNDSQTLIRINNTSTGGRVWNIGSLSTASGLGTGGSFVFRDSTQGYSQLQVGQYNQTIALQDASPQSGNGITFPASQNASANANTLDDYEEGTWTAQAGSETGAFTATYNGQAGKYVKIGNRVWATFDLTLTSRTLTGSIAFVYGLPFPVANNGDLSGSFGAPALCSTPGSNFYQLGIYAQNNASYMYVTCTTSNTSGLTPISNAFWGASTRLCGGVVYNTTS